MTREIWTDQELREATGKVREVLLGAVPPPSQCLHEFSLPFQTGIEEMKRKKNKHKAGMSVLTKIAAILLVVMLGTGVWAHVSPDSWAAVQSWVEECYENSVIYRFLNPEPAGMASLNSEPVEGGKRHIGWLPDGYKESDDMMWADVEMTKYVNEDGDAIYLSLFSASDSAFSSLQADDSGTYVLVGGIPGVFIAGESDQNELTWVANDGQFGYWISSTLPMETIIKMAKSIY